MRQAKSLFRSIILLVSMCFYQSICAQDKPLYDLGIKDTIIIEGCKDYAPFDFLDENGKYAGFDFEIMDALMQRMHLPYKYHLQDVEEIFKDDNKDGIDIISGITFSTKHRHSFSYGIPLLYVWQKIVTLETHPIDRVESLRGKRIAMRTSDWSKDPNAPVLNEAKEIIVDNNWDNLLSMLQKGQIDAIIAGSFPIEYTARKLGIRNLHYADFSEKPLMQSYAVPNGKEELLFRLNEELQILKQDGTYEKIYNKWFGVYQEKERVVLFEHILLAIAGILIIIGLFYLVNYANKLRMYRLEMVLSLKTGKLTSFIYNPDKKTLYRLNLIDDNKERTIPQTELADCLIEKDWIALEKANNDLLNGVEKEIEIRVKFKDDVPQLGGRTFEFNLAKDGKKFNRTLIIGVYKDVTEHVLSEERLENEKKQSDKANQMKSLFLSSMSHDIRTPLNAIVGASEILTMEDDQIELSDEDKKQMFDMIKLNVNVATTLVSDLLDVTKMEGGSYQIKVSPIKLNMLCKVVEESVRSRLKDGVQFYFKPGMGDGYILNTDPVRLQHVLTNYMTNACKYTDKGSIELAYQIIDDHILFSVTDTGIGIAEENVESCFELYNMLGSNESGHGLGLYICKLTSNLMHGKVYVDTSYKEGARFVFEHPLDL